MNKLPQKGEFKYDKEKQILSVKWMNAEGNKEINNATYDEKVSLLVQTRNYEEGETITIVIDEIKGKDINEQGKEITLIGKVDKEGTTLLKEEVEILQQTQNERALTEEKYRKNEEHKATAIYKIYQGKNYTYNEWVIKEQELWEEYQQNKKKK